MVTDQRGAQRQFCLVLVKPSHYDDNGYVIQWMRSPVPSNSLASLCGLAKDCAERRVLGDDVEIDIHAFDETNIRIRPDASGGDDRCSRRRHGHAGRRAVEPIPARARHRAAVSRRAASKSASAASTSPACCRCWTASTPISTAPAPWACRCSPARRKAGSTRCCAMPRRARSSRSTITWTNCLGSKARRSRSCRRNARSAPSARLTSLRRRPRLPLPVLVLHHHQRAGPQIAPPLAGRYRKDRARELRARAARLLHHRRQFRPQQGLGADPRPDDPAARNRKAQSELHHPGRHALPQTAELHREVRARRRQARFHRPGEHQPGQSRRRQEAPEQDHRIPHDAARLEDPRA